MLSPNNLLKPSDGGPVTVPTQDMVLGIYYLTQSREGEPGEGKAFKGVEEAIMAYTDHTISLQSMIYVRKEKKDENGNVVWEGYYDEIHAQVNCADGYFSVERGYDTEGRLISERYLDRFNKLTNNTEGIAGWNGYYDNQGNLVVTNCYDKDRNAVPYDNQ